MSSSILNAIGIDPGFILVFMMFILVFVLIYLLRISMKLTRLTKRYRVFMRGKDAQSLEKTFERRFGELDEILDTMHYQQEQIEEVKRILSKTTNKIGIIKYDAFPDVGGRLSFALAMLDESNSGFVLNAIHSREGCYTYVKEIVKGESYIALGKEEKDALKQAVNYYAVDNNKIIK